MTDGKISPASGHAVLIIVGTLLVLFHEAGGFDGE